MRKKQVTDTVFYILLLTIFISGCSTIKETAKGIIGISTKEIEASRESAIKRQFNWGYDDCRDKTMKVLARIGAYVYAQDPAKHMIAVYLSGSDTTIVGIFLKAIDANNTEIEVASPSTFGKESIAEGLFSGLEKGLYLDENLDIEKTPNKGESNAL